MQLSLPWSSRPLSKSGAFTLHLVISLLVFSSLVAVMVLFWFPGELFFIDGGWQGLKLVAMVDLVLGPALTLLLYKPNKPKLMLDMSLIAGIQIVALAYGFYTTHQQRTLAVVFADRTFFTVSASDNQQANDLLRKLDITPQAVPKASLLNIPLLLTPDPENGNHGKFLEDYMNGYPGPQQRNDLYVSLEKNTDAMKKHALDEQRLEDMGVSPLIAASLKRRSLRKNDVEFYKFKARYGNGVVVFNPETASILDYISTDNIVKPTTEAASDNEPEGQLL